MRRKVLITGPVFSDPGGVASYCGTMIPALREACDLDFEYVSIGRRSAGDRSPLRLLGDQRRYLGELERHRPAMVQLNPSLDIKSFLRDSLFALAAVRRRIPLLVFVHGWNDAHAARIGRWLRWLFRAGLGKARVIIVLSDDIGSRLRGWGTRARIVRDTTVIPDALLDEVCLQERLSGLEQDQILRVLFLARLEAEKGVLETIDAVTALVSEGMQVALTVAGDGSAMDLVRRRVERDSIAREAVSVVGYVRGVEKNRIFREHHIYCLPTYHGEGMPISLVEAFAFGMPVVTCAAGGIADTFIDGDMGIIVPPRDVGALTDALRRLVGDRFGMQRMAAFNHRHAAQHYSASAAAKRLRDVYSDLLD